MKVLTEKEAEDFLKKEGFAVAETIEIKKEKDLKKILKKIPFPWAVKVSSKSILHKKKIGGVKLNIKNIEDAKKAYSRIKKIKNASGALVQSMLRGEELILGLKETKEFGKVLAFGKGGSNVEKEKNVIFRTINITKKEAEKMFEEIKGNIEKGKEKKLIIKNLLKLITLAKKYPEIKELDINPLIVNKKEALVADARIILN